MDLEPRYEDVLRHQYPEAVLHLGEQAGDLTRLRLQDVPLGDILMAGPPCLGWAGNGARKGTKDSRSQPFLVILKWVIHGAEAGTLKSFLIENVVGIAKCSKGHESMLQRVLRVLREHCPQMIFDSRKLSAKDYKMCQDRTMAPFGAAKLDSFLSTSIPNIDRRDFRGMKRKNVFEYE